MNVMKALIIAIVLGAASLSLGQDQPHSKKEDSLYAMALFASVSEMDKQWSRYSKRDDTTSATDYHHMFVEADRQITADLPSESAGYRVEYLDDKAQTAQYQKLKREFALLKIFPIENEGAKLKVVINLSYLRSKKGHLWYGLSGWSIVEFQFDCSQQEFVIASVKLGGI